MMKLVDSQVKHPGGPNAISAQQSMKLGTYYYYRHAIAVANWASLPRV
jgi:hypothetical protein